MSICKKEFTNANLRLFGGPDAPSRKLQAFQIAAELLFLLKQL